MDDGGEMFPYGDIFDTDTFIGVKHVGAGAQITLATHPGLFTDGSLLNLNVKQPLALVEVNGPGIEFPQKAPAIFPGTFPAGLVLVI